MDELRHHLPRQPQLETHELAVSEPMRLRGEGAGAIRLLHMAFQPAPGVHIVAAICRHEHSFALLQGMVARRLYPVLERYIRLWWMHRTERRRADAFENAVDIAELGVILLDRRGQLLFQNAYVRRILDGGDGMRRVGNTVMPTDNADALRLQAAVQHALLCNVAAERDASRDVPLILLRRGGPLRSLIVTIVPHPARAVDPGDAAAIMYVLHPEHDMRKCLAPVYRIYGLTLAEARLVTEMVKGSNLLEAATLMNVTVATVRAQLKQIFEKTRTNRQAELVRLMLASAIRSSVSVDLSLI